jgi:ABC-2 type transport system ATP-binding protein
VTPPLAQTEEVVKRFGELAAVDRVTLEVREGEVVGLLGANGAGKTTLIRMLLGLLRPTRGEVRLFGRWPSRETRKRLGYVPQGLGLYDDLTVAENLAFAAAIFGADPPRLEEDLAPARRKLIRDLSLGAQRRVAFAEALGHRPRLLVLDEPTSGVDPLGRARLWNTIQEAAEGGAGVLVTTHHMDEAGHCDRLVVMAAGRVVASGPLDDLIGDARTVEVRGSRWQDAFQALDAAGIAAALVGTTLRVPGTDEAEVRDALRRAQVEASTRLVRSTLEETFLVLSREAA